MALMGEVARVRLERRRRRRDCVVVAVDVDEDGVSAVTLGGVVGSVVGCGDCCIGVV